MNIKDTIDKIKEIITMLPSIIETSTAIFLTPGDKQAFQEAISILKAYEEASTMLPEFPTPLIEYVGEKPECIKIAEARNKGIQVCIPILAKAIKERDELKDKLDKITVERVEEIADYFKDNKSPYGINWCERENKPSEPNSIGMCDECGGKVRLKTLSEAIVSDIKGGE